MPMLQHTIFLADMLRVVGIEVNAPDCKIDSICSLEDAGSSSLSFCLPNHADALKKTKAAAVLTVEKLKPFVPPACIVVVCQAPWMQMHALLKHYFARPMPAAYIDPTAIVSSQATVHASCVIEPGVIIEEHVVLGEHVHVQAGAHIASRAQIAEGCVIGPKAFIAHGVKLGRYCVVGHMSVIGADGFGYLPTDKGIEKIIHAGSVELGDRVELGTHCSVCRGVLSDTRIGDHCKLDNYVHIAHNVVVGKRAFFAAGSAVAGSTIIGDDFRMGGNSGVNGHIRICDGVSLAGGSNIHKSVTSPGKYLGVFPARKVKDWVRLMSHCEPETS